MPSARSYRKSRWTMCVAATAGLVLATASAHAAAEVPDSTATRARATLIPFPFVFYSEETELGGGMSLSYVTREAGAPEDARPAQYGLLALYTERDQYQVGVNIDRYFDREKWHLVTGATFSEFPGDFFGFGNDTDPDSSEVFTPRGVLLAFELERRIAGRWQTGPNLTWYQRDLVRIEEAGRLERDRPTGVRDGAVLLVGWSATRDARSHTFYPRDGSWLRFTTAFSSSSLAGDFSYSHHSIDLRRYRSIGENVRGRPVLALRALLVHSASGVPFDLMPTLGGANVLRGTFGGRYRDRALGAVQAELRAGHWKRLGVVAFAETGTVAAGIDAMRVADLHFGYGLGVRWQLSKAEQIHVRADLGFDDEGGSGFYLAFLEAF